MALRHDLLLRNLLVADLSDDSLWAHLRLGGFSPFTIAGNHGCAFPGGLLRPAFTGDQALWTNGHLRGSPDLDSDRLAALRLDRAIMERAWLLAGVSSDPYPISPLGRSLLDHFSDSVVQQCHRAASDSATSSAPHRRPGGGGARHSDLIRSLQTHNGGSRTRRS